MPREQQASRRVAGLEVAICFLNGVYWNFKSGVLYSAGIPVYPLPVYL